VVLAVNKEERTPPPLTSTLPSSPSPGFRDFFRAAPACNKHRGFRAGKLTSSSPFSWAGLKEPLRPPGVVGGFNSCNTSSTWGGRSVFSLCFLVVFSAIECVYGCFTLIKKKIFSSYIRKFRMEQLQSNI
jgi:hypothetical protein